MKKERTRVLRKEISFCNSLTRELNYWFPAYAGSMTSQGSNSIESKKRSVKINQRRKNKALRKERNEEKRYEPVDLFPPSFSTLN